MHIDQWTLFDDLPAARAGEYILPDHADVTACRSCGASIVWTRTAAGRALPLSLATVARRDGVAFALSHWVDCPESREWRRR